MYIHDLFYNLESKVVPSCVVIFALSYIFVASFCYFDVLNWSYISKLTINDKTVTFRHLGLQSIIYKVKPRPFITFLPKFTDQHCCLPSGRNFTREPGKHGRQWLNLLGQVASTQSSKRFIQSSKFIDTSMNYQNMSPAEKDRHHQAHCPRPPRP